jgi:Cystatin domain
MDIKLKHLLLLSLVSVAYSGNTGGISEIDVNDPRVAQLLKDHLPRLVTGDGGSFTLVSKKSISEQVVSGIIYRITGEFKAGNKNPETCTVSIWTREWLSNPEEKFKIKADCSGTSYRVASAKTSSGW